MDKIEMQLETVRFWQDYLEQSQREGWIVPRLLKDKLWQAEEKLFRYLQEEHNQGNCFMISKTVH